MPQSSVVDDEDAHFGEHKIRAFAPGYVLDLRSARIRRASHYGAYGHLPNSSPNTGPVKLTETRSGWSNPSQSNSPPESLESCREV